MASQRRTSKSYKSSINYWWIPLDKQSLEPDSFLPKSISHGKNSAQSESKFPHRKMSTQQFVSAVAGIWDFIGQPAVLHTKESFRYHEICQKVSTTYYSSDQKEQQLASSSCETMGNDIKYKNCSPLSAKSAFEELKEIKKVLLFASCNRDISNSFIWKHVPTDGTVPHLNSFQTGKVEKREASNELESPSGSTNMKTEYQMKDLVMVEERGKDDITISQKNNYSTDFSTSMKNGSNATSICQDTSKDNNVNRENFQHDNSLDPTYSLQSITSTKEAIIVLRNLTTGLDLDYNIELLTSTDCTNSQQKNQTDSHSMVSNLAVENSAKKEHYVHKNDDFLHQQQVLEWYSPHSWASIQQRLHNAFATNRNAMAGALAGTLVSLCLHPVDTVKTVIQANGTSQKSFYEVLSRIITEKGVLGLYRGIASNITSSAPISAIYTFTYESVKGALIPVLPKEYHSLAHCIAGGCSSIATSFVFTPSERIKQQMQVGSQYQNCWNALIGCVEKGGITSLYDGWFAVLCRNIPHSIIKFYTYERLKQMMLTSAAPNGSLSSWQTLVCGGLAGSTAALFTTPFDVVKTRLQTQAPGTLGKYYGVFHALQEITKQEGLQGLYRGLVPRLAMYVLQGAIFFASYEFLKAVLSLDVPKFPAKFIENEQE
ncbi:mitochondrial aspartate-glutamate transporter AGC1 [Typha angustifolia]|uniref:mitochondrial aspartate-glutamate transporter AGC1 n=1 Tax=Typha angustifolia TaxID=59011 RepID=UPI003C303A24